MPITSRKSQVGVRRSAGDPLPTALKGTPTNQDTDDDLQSVVRGAFTNQISDPFTANNLYVTGATGELSIVPPPVNVNALLRMPNDNSILRQCIETMVTNVEGHGYRLEYIGPDGEAKSEAAQTEFDYIHDFLSTLHPEHSITEIRKRVRWDVETLGFAYLEVGRSKDGLPIFVSHIPAHTMRMTAIDNVDVPVPVTEFRFGKKIEGVMNRKFRRFVQISGTKKVYFKEFGDPRQIDPKNGAVDNALSYEDTATEIILVKQYYPGQLYGLPRWFNNLVAIQGSRQAELTNLDFFKDNAIPALAVLVSGGALTRDTIRQIEEHVTAARGRAAQNRVLLIEVEGDPKAASKEGTIPAPKIDLKPLAGERPSEGQFLNYDKAQTEKVRSSFRLPPIFTGHAQDYTRASAQTSYEVAEGQVFGPEREVLDEIINRHLLLPYGVTYWAVRSNPPRISDPQEVISAMTAFEAVGAMTPNVAIGLANEQFGLDIPSIEEAWGDYPFSVVKVLATAGKLEGFDDIMKEIEEADIPGAVTVDDPDEETDPNEGPDEEDDGDQEGDKTKQVRQALDTLRDVLETAQRSAYRSREINPPPRTRPQINNVFHSNSPPFPEEVKALA